eukprot:TRINITY_DN2666_c1_g1_i1.p1 TRINITY_DN2666_c1_g1~~TRINITY_DN2666_c1_g1_i1.p1  ORF type:complete len:275 (+),score=55.32 TRINITY_DN2666_c1_g1_i1:412-1236(+)
MKIVYPFWVVLVRGNHEEKRINQKYQFEAEVRSKYDAKMFDHVTNIFPLLPIGVVLDHKIIVIHGGLPKVERCLLSDIQALNRKIELPKPQLCKTRDLKILEGLLWSDPVETTDQWEESKRGCGIFWGKNVTKEFLKINQLQMIIRSHQLCNNGHKFNHYKRVVTIFSCSYYCGINNNKGAYLVLDNNDLTNPRFISYTAEIDHIGSEAEPSTRSTRRKTETLQKIRARIYSKRRKLWDAFVSFDEGRTGFVTKSQWTKAMSKTLKLPILWGKI